MLGGQKYIVAADAKITLVTPKSKGLSYDASLLNKDADADYEVDSTITAKGLVDALKKADKTLEYNYAGKTTDSDNEVLKELYVTVTKAEANTVPGGPTFNPTGYELSGYSDLTMIMGTGDAE